MFGKDTFELFTPQTRALMARPGRALIAPFLFIDDDDSRRDALTPSWWEQGFKQSPIHCSASSLSTVCVLWHWACGCFSHYRFSRRPALTAGRTSSTSRSISSPTDTAPSFLPLFKARRCRSFPATKVRSQWSTSSWTHHISYQTCTKYEIKSHRWECHVLKPATFKELRTSKVHTWLNYFNYYYYLTTT